MRLAFRELRQFTERFFSIAGEEDLVRLQRELEENPEKADLSPAERRALSQVVALLKEEA